MYDMVLAETEALAQENWGNEWNDWTDWLDQGFTKDEWGKTVECSKTTGWSINIGIFSYDNKETIYGTKWACFNGGNANCYPEECS